MNSHFLIGFIKRAMHTGLSREEALAIFSKTANFIPTIPNNTPVLNQPMQLGKPDMQPRPMLAPQNKMMAAPKPTTDNSKPIKLTS